MPDRVVSYSFRGNFSQFTAGLTAAGRGVNDFGDKVTALDRNGAKMRAGLDQVGRTAGRIGLVAAVGLGAAVLAAANFDQAMSNVQAATHETAENMDLLREAALKAGAETVYSATEAAAAIESLAKAGVSTEDILSGGLAGALNLAAAGGLEVAAAADIAATALTQFKLEGSDVGHVADLLAAGAGKAQGDVTDLGMALKQSGLVASQMGLSIESTTGTLAAFASAGLLGSDAGTAFRTMLLRLANPTDESARLMEQLGINAYDASGQFVGMTSVAGQLKTAFEGKTQAERDSALATIFGSDAIRAAAVLYEQGADGVQQWINKTNDSGYAAETAATRLDNLKGDLEQFRGALETALIGGGDGSQGALRPLIQGATDLVNVFNKLPGPAQNATSALLAITAVTGGALWFGSKVIGGIANTRQALDDLGISAGGARTKLAKIGGTAVGILAVGSAVGALTDGMGRIDSKNLDRALESLALTGKTSEDLERVVDNIGSVTSKLNAIDLGEVVRLGGLFGDTTLDKQADNIDQVDQALAQLVETGESDKAATVFDRLKELAAGKGIDPRKVTDQFDAYSLALENAAAAAEETTAPTDALAGSTTGVGVAAGQSAEQITDLIEAMEKQRDAALSAFDAETQYRQALKDATEQGKESEAGIKGNSEEALKNRDTISSLAEAWNNQSDAVQNTKGKFAQARADFIKTATAMGVPKAEARRLANRLLEIPNSKVIPVSTPGMGEAIANAKTLRDLLSTIGLNSSNVPFYDQAFPKTKKAAGGLIYGPGTKTSDSVPIAASAGEFMQRAAAVDYYGVDFMEDINNLRLPKYAQGGRIGGGLRSYVTSSSYVDADSFPRTLKQWTGVLEKSAKVVEREKNERQALIDKRDAVSSAIQSSYRSDVFGQQPDASVWMSPAERAAAGVGDTRSTVTGDINDLKALQSAITLLKKKGFDGPALADLLSNGSLEEVQAYANDSKSSLASLEALFNERDRLLAATGAAGGNAAFGAAIAAQTAEWKRIAAYNRQLNIRFDRIEKQLKRSPKETGDAVGKAVNGAGPNRPRT